MTDRASILHKLKEKNGESTNKETVKAFSERPRKKNETGWAGKANESIPEAIGYIVMKEKFEQMYRHIERLTLQHDQLLVKSVSKPIDLYKSTSIDISHDEAYLETQNDQKCSLPSVTTPQLEINTVT